MDAAGAGVPVILPLRTDDDDGLSVLRMIHNRLTELLCSIAWNAINTVRAVQGMYDPSRRPCCGIQGK